ncbi:alpha/beta hydrolase [Bradyrhizobium xenonodulans]|uniref:Alpha/beta hydrolase n=1 Tax=Bradyrhizobium xenonodulans TaxID=2736875 RepID=A0ABY7MPF5_9BRAD|nr:alpha/beta hydrolase [Bradyrhizobium xenonodulans]WBL80224.1 alpha/beta hydrolase [Bradyrhizobium xenonodulans]
MPKVSGKSTAPVTLIYGDSDWSRPGECERTRSLIPAAQMVTLENTGHVSAVENPSKLARVILAAERAPGQTEEPNYLQAQ